MTFIFSTTGRLLSRVIRWTTQSEMSHCGVSLTIGKESFVIDASLLGVEMVRRDLWERKKRIVSEYLVDRAFEPRTDALLHFLGEGYDYSGLFGYLPVFLARWFGRKVRNPWASPTLSVCSEFLVRAMQSARHPVWQLMDPETSSPKDCALACEHSFFMRVQ